MTKIGSPKAISKERVRILKFILENELGRPVSFEEAATIGGNLIKVYTNLYGTQPLKKAKIKEVNYG